MEYVLWIVLMSIETLQQNSLLIIDDSNMESSGIGARYDK
jgi:hypothetical protein